MSEQAKRLAGVLVEMARVRENCSRLAFEKKINEAFAPLIEENERLKALIFNFEKHSGNSTYAEGYNMAVSDMQDDLRSALSESKEADNGN